MEPHVALFLVPVSLGLGICMMIWGIRYFENKENMALIERGMRPKTRHKADPTRSLRNGLMFVGAGAGLLLAIFITNVVGVSEGESAGIHFGLVAIGGGLGILSAYHYERKNPPAREEE